MTHLVDIYLQPGKVFADLKAKPTFLVPLLLMALLSAAMVLLYYGKVDPAWLTDRTLLAMGDDMGAAELEQGRTSLPEPQTMGYFGAASVLVATAVMAALYALYFMLAGKVTGAAISFRHGLSLTAWAGMPLLLGAIIGLVGVLTMTPQTPIESLMLANVDPLLVQLPLDHKWSGLAKGFSLLNLWTWFLVALGWRTWTRSSWLQAAIVAIVPAAVVYGVMALLA